MQVRRLSGLFFVSLCVSVFGFFCLGFLVDFRVGFLCLGLFGVFVCVCMFGFLVVWFWLSFL